MKLRRLMAIGMTVALTATMFSGVSVYAENSDPEPFKSDFRGILQIQTQPGFPFTTT